MNVLAIGAHPDDIEIGCGGTLAAHARVGDRVMMVVMTAGEMGGASADIRLKEFANAAKVLGVESTLCLGYPDTRIPRDGTPLTKLDDIVRTFKPDRAYVPFIREIHQDHRETAHLALSACRNISQILMYEGPSTYADFVVTYFSDIADTLEQKKQAIACHASQGQKEILKLEAIRSLNRFRGYQSRCDYAEGFAIFRFVDRFSFVSPV